MHGMATLETQPALEMRPYQHCMQGESTPPNRNETKSAGALQLKKIATERLYQRVLEQRSQGTST